MNKIQQKKRGKTGNRIFPYIMCAPAIIIFTMFVMIPFFYGIYISFHSWNGLSAMTWNGVKNYIFTFQDDVFLEALGHTFIYAVLVTVLKNVTGLLLAILVRKKFRGRTAFRVAIYLPVTFSYVVIGVLWSWIFNPTFGLLNNFLEVIGADFLIQGWLSDPKIALYSIIFVDVWRWCGFHMILYLAGLQGIPQDLYEAAALDGANARQRFRYITVPQLNSTLVINVLMALTGAFISNYDIVNVMTGGGPFNSTEVALTYIMKTALTLNNMGKACAMSVILFLIVLVFGFIQMRTMSRDENYAD